MQVLPTQSLLQNPIVPPQAAPVVERITPVEPARRVTANKETGSSGLSGHAKNNSPATTTRTRGQTLDLTA